MPVTDRLTDPSQAVIAESGDDRILPFWVLRLFIHQVPKDIIRPVDPVPIPVNIQTEIPFPIILELLRISRLVCLFSHLPQAVVLVLDRIPVPIDWTEVYS